jgi:hypothetical protein
LESGLRSCHSIDSVFGRDSGIAHARNVILVDFIVVPIKEEGIVDGSQIDLLRN